MSTGGGLLTIGGASVNIVDGLMSIDGGLMMSWRRIGGLLAVHGKLVMSW